MAEIYVWYQPLFPPVQPWTIPYNTMNHFNLECTRIASLLSSEDPKRREDIRSTTAPVQSRLNMPQDEALFYQPMHCMALKFSWSGAAENRQREEAADRESLAVLEDGWETYELQQEKDRER
jgi:hypothetical protein